MEDQGETETVGPEGHPEPLGQKLPPGTLVANRYEVLGVLGSGGNATVYRAQDRDLRLEVALKVLRPDRQTTGALSRFRREVAIARDASSERLIRIFDIGITPEGPYLTMEVMSGGSLGDRIRQRPLPVPEAIRIGQEILEGIAALHTLSIVHRDIKPGNILFAASGKVKLADFGLARRLGPDETRATMTGGILGTIAYLSPEQALGKEALPQSDLYSAGVVLFEMLAGRLPYDAESHLGALLAHAHSPAPNLQVLRPEVPRWLARVVRRLLEKRPEDRYPSAEAALRDLRTSRAARLLSARGGRAVRIAGVVVLLLAGAGVLVRNYLFPAPRFSHLIPQEDGIAAVDVTGRRLWELSGVAPEIADRTARARITPGGPLLIAAVLAPPGKWLREDVSTLSFLDPETGEVERRAPLPFGAGLFRSDPPRFDPSSITAVDLFHDGTDQVLVSYTHVPEAPSYTVLYSPLADRARIVFYARGGQRFQGTTDLDGDGRSELLFAGVNNGWNWVNAVAAVRLDPLPWTEANWMGAPAATPDIAGEPAFARLLLWYAVVPQGHLDNPSLAIDARKRTLTLRYDSGKTWALGFDGFPWEASPGVPHRQRQEARRTTYEHLRETERLRKIGAFDLAMGEAASAITSAGLAEELWLGQYAERLQAKILVEEKKIPEAEARFAALTERAEDGPEVAYDAAVAFHLHGDLRRAVAWYERGMGRGSAMGAGKSKHEFLKGEVLALVEAKRYEEAFAAVDRFLETYPVWQNELWLFREFVRWRAGGRPRIDSSKVRPSWPDLERYWALECEFASGAQPREMLPRVDRFLAEEPETRAEALSLRAELLARLGRRTEASEAAESAFELARREAGRSIIARGHVDLLAARARRLRKTIPLMAPAGPSGVR